MSLCGQAMVSWVEEEKTLPMAQKQLNSPTLELAAGGEVVSWPQMPACRGRAPIHSGVIANTLQEEDKAFAQP